MANPTHDDVDKIFEKALKPPEQLKRTPSKSKAMNALLAKARMNANSRIT